MDAAQKPNQNTDQPANSLLEGSDTLLENSDDSLDQPLIATEPSGGGSSNVPPPPKLPWWVRLRRRFNIYLVLLLVVLLLIGGVVITAFVLNKRQAPKTTVPTQPLSSSTLKQLATSDVTVGQPKQTLNVQSNAVFAGQVLIRDSLQVAGTIQVGGSLSIPGITVSGTSLFDQVQVNKDLNVTGNTALQGQLAIQKTLSVAGNATFGGAVSAAQLSATNLQLNGDLTLTHHLVIGGTTPSRSNGTALGSGGTTSVSGSDTSGSVNINTGSGASAGCFLTVTFAQKFNSTPHIMITPVGASAAGLSYYINRSTTGFSICTTDPPPSNATFGYDYFATD